MNFVRILAFVAVFATIPVRVAHAFVAAQPTNAPASSPNDDDEGPANGQWGGQPQEVEDYSDDSEQGQAGKNPASVPDDEGQDNAPMDDNIDYN